MNDQNFVLSVLTLEEFGATGNKVDCASCVIAMHMAMHMLLKLFLQFMEAVTGFVC